MEQLANSEADRVEKATWQRELSSKELGEFVMARLARLENSGALEEATGDEFTIPEDFKLAA